MDEAKKPLLVKTKTPKKLTWRVNTPQLLREILQNKGTSILSIPLSIFGKILYMVGERASELNDPKLNALMCQLAIYDVSNPYSGNYDHELVSEIIKKGYSI